jgi:hypothetical protein
VSCNEKIPPEGSGRDFPSAVAQKAMADKKVGKTGRGPFLLIPSDINKVPGDGGGHRRKTVHLIQQPIGCRAPLHQQNRIVVSRVHKNNGPLRGPVYKG